MEDDGSNLEISGTAKPLGGDARGSIPKVELLKILPQMLWILLAALALWVLSGPLTRIMERQGLSKVSVAGFSVEFARAQFAKAGDGKINPITTPEAFAPFAERIRRSAAKLAGARMLWVDDHHPTQNFYERRAFAALGVSVDMARTNEEAMALLTMGGETPAYDLVLTDSGRDAEPGSAAPCFPYRGAPSSGGCGLLRSMYQRFGEAMPPAIMYTGSYQPDWGVPSYAFGVTNRVDRLLELVLDAMERRPDAEVTEDIRSVPSAGNESGDTG